MLLNRETGETQIEGTGVTIVYTIESVMWIEKHVDGLTPMELLERASQGKVSMSHLQIMVWAGMEAWRRRNASYGPQVNPAQAVKVIEDGGGLQPVQNQVFNAFALSPALGLNLGRSSPEPEVPTTGEKSPDASSEPVFTPETSGL